MSEVGLCAELGVLGHFDSLVPGQRAAELLGQGGDRRSDGVSYGLGAVAGESGPVVDPLPFAVAWHGWKVQQHREPGGALHQRPDRGNSQGPMMRSPSQWPGTARSSASAGRWVIMISGANETSCVASGFVPWGPAKLARFADTPTSSRFSAPRPCT